MYGTYNKPPQKKVPVRTPRQILPVLIPATKGEEHDGVANFYLIAERDVHGITARLGPPVRLLRNRDISEAAIRRVLTPQEYEFLTGTLDLKKAREKNDPLLHQRANQKLMPFLGISEKPL